MSALHRPSRRAFLATGAAAGVVATLPACSAGPSATDRQLVFASLADALRELDRLTKPVALHAAGTWTWSKTLLHCAQSIDYSLTGYPEAKPALFRYTAGAAGFSYFKSRGRMSHNLLEAIPGAAMLDANAAGELAMATLRKSIDKFIAFSGTLAPHFAYGSLSKADYELAHAMHIANHLSGFDVAGSSAVKSHSKG
jgi:hypothetical protein